jgi:ATP-dependent helicase/nuclease subunit A
MATVPAGDRLTAQQRDAVFRREVSVVLSSGAGCGKTHVLTRRYLSHLEEDGAEVGQVVAITFTDRAARQMRDRIRKAVLANLECAATDAEVARWEEHLRGLETAQISTIHALGANLLRQHAIEAGLDPRFDVLQDYLTVNLQREALTECLQALLTADSPPGRDLRELVLLYGWRPTVEVVQRLLSEEDAQMRHEWARRPPTEVAAAWRSYARAELLPRYVAYLTAASPKVARCLWLLRTTPCVGPKMKANVARLLTETPRLAEASDLGAAVEELREAAKVGTERAKAWPSEEVYETIKDALEDFRTGLADRMNLFTAEPEGLGAAAETGQRFVRVADDAVRAYRQLKRRSAVVDFQDLLVRTRDLLRDRPEVRERLQRRIRFLLIDELQDTDPVQMELVEYLTGAGLTQGKLFAVGDHSQSIYRFRRADVRLFQGLKRRMAHEGRLGLTQNFRSQPAILDFTNALVGAAKKVSGTVSGTPSPETVPDTFFAVNALEDYEPLRPHHRQLNPGPCVEFLWSPRGDALAAEARCLEADWIARRIAAMVGNREALVVERSGREESLRPARLGDIVLLFRAMTNVELYEAALRNYGLDYYLVGGRAFFAQQEIYDLLNLLRALENPQDAVSLVGTLRSPFCCLSDEALFVLSRHRNGTWAGLHDADTCRRLPADQRPRAERARRFLDRWHGLKDRLPIARLLGEVFADSGYDASTQFEFLGDRKLANLWKLLDMARDFDRSGLFGLAEFIERLGDLVRTQPREEQAATQPENADVVRLMTIHQAKGLEFPVVFVPDLAASGGGAHHPVAVWHPRLGCVPRPPAEDPPPFSDFAWKVWEASEAVDDWREDLRTLYVACTRAQDYLVLSAALPANFSPQSTWMLTLAERFDLASGRCLDENVPAEYRPLVRVTNHLSPPPEVPPLPPSPRSAGQPTPGDTARTPQRPSTGDGVPVVTVGELERLLDPTAPAPAPADWDSEDGSDRSTWELPRERIERSPDTDGARRDRAIRAVLGAWDFRDPDGWQALLEGGPGLDLAHVFRTFARTPVFGQLGKAREYCRDLEYLLPLPAVPVVVRGVIDCLWKDHAGRWHVLQYDTSAAADAGGRKRTPKLQSRLVLAALAAEALVGVAPKTVRCYACDTGRTATLSGGREEWQAALVEVQRALAAVPSWTPSAK